MRGKIAIPLAFILILALHGLALGEGGPRPPDEPSDPRQDPNTVGAYIKGRFTVAYDKATPGDYTHHNVQAVLEWVMQSGKLKGWLKGKENLYEVTDFRKRMTGITEKTRPGKPLRGMHLFSAPIVERESNPLCTYTEDDLRKKYHNLAKNWHVPEAFGVQGAETYITTLKIIKKDFCGAPGTPIKDEPKAMIYGEVEIIMYKK